MKKGQFYKALTEAQVDKLLSKFKFKTTPMHHQKVGLLYALDRKGVGLFYDIGTGKTLTALYIAKYIWKCKRILVVCPSSIVSTWEEEVDQHCPSRVHTLPSGNDNRRRVLLSTLRGESLTVLNYEGVRGVFGHKEKVRGQTIIELDSKMKKVDFDCIIFDESHHIKNPDALQTQVCAMLSQKTPYRILMSGTPATEKYENLWSQIFCLDGGQRLGSNYWGFLRKYFNKVFYSWKIKKGADEKIMSQIDDIVLSYSQEECFDLPEITYQKHFVVMSKEQMEVYDGIRQGFLEMIDANVPIVNQLSEASKMRQVTGGFIYDENKEPVYMKDHTKVIELREIVKQCLRRTGKILIYYTYTAEAELILDAVKDLAPSRILKDGKEVQNDLISIKNVDGARIIIASPNIFGEGVNFTVANTVIFYSSGYSGEKRLQTIGRVHRKGQKENCLIIDLLVKNSIDEAVLKIAEDKIIENSKRVHYLSDYV